MSHPKTDYARSGDLHIAYQVVGDGPIDVVYVPGFVSNVEMWWQDPLAKRFFERISSFARLILFDKRGSGLSDRPGHPATLEERMDDVRAVMDAAGSQRAALFGMSEGGPMCLLFAATYPERAVSIVLAGSFASFPHAFIDDIEVHAATIRESWGRAGIFLSLAGPSLAGDTQALEFWSRFERYAASPGAAEALLRMNVQVDAAHVLGSVKVPTLVIHRSGDQIVPVELGRVVAENVPNAELVELPGDDHFPWVGDMHPVLDRMQHFLVGSRPQVETDRVLATVLFTDIVGSTERAVELGDQRWRELLTRHNSLVRSEIERFRGREIHNPGDGFLATFDGPARAIHCAQAVRNGVLPLGLEVRAGLHTGECELMGDNVGGIAVHIGARVADAAAPGEVLVSSTVRDLVAGSGIHFEARGETTLKGVPDPWRLFRVAEAA